MGPRRGAAAGGTTPVSGGLTVDVPPLSIEQRGMIARRRASCFA
jgi:hypothetical protein